MGQDGGVRAVRCVQGAIQVVDAPEPEGEVGVRVVSAGICGSDHHLISQGFVEGRIIGHEVAGLLDDGTPVAIEPVAGCGVCERCVRGDYHVCGQPGFSIRGISDDGGMAERMAVPASAIVALPSGVRAEDACLVEPLAVLPVRSEASRAVSCWSVSALTRLSAKPYGCQSPAACID